LISGWRLRYACKVVVPAFIAPMIKKSGIRFFDLTLFLSKNI
jgi:hypothetical protein